MRQGGHTRSTDENLGTRLSEAALKANHDTAIGSALLEFLGS